MAFVFVTVQLHFKRAHHIRRASFQLHRSPLRRYLAHREVVLFGKLFHFLNRPAIGAVFRREFFPRNHRAPGVRRNRPHFWLQDDRDFDPLVIALIAHARAEGFDLASG